MIFVLLVCASAIAWCGENGAGDKAAAESPKLAQILVTLAEYKIEKPIPVKAPEAEILKSIRDSGVMPSETVRATVAADTQSIVNFGKRVTVTTGKISRGPVTSRQTETMEIGTILQLQLTEHPKGAIAEIDYTTSRLEGGGNDDSPPDVVTNTVQATQVYALGEQRLLSTSGSENVTCIFVSIQRMP